MRGYQDEKEQYRPVTSFVEKLPSGVYKIRDDHMGIYAEPHKFEKTNTILFNNSKQEEIYNEIFDFWSLSDKYENLKEPHKRGYLLYGPQGCGKTYLINNIINKFIKEYDGVVFMFTPWLFRFIENFYKIEEGRKHIIVIEDLDFWLYRHENRVLDLLDGSVALNNSIVLGTTNFIEELPQRIKNRPSRFDRKIKMGFPAKNVRKQYLKIKYPELDKEKTKKWVDATEDFTIAHLKELIVSVKLYDKTFEESLSILKELMKCEEDTEKDLKRAKGQRGGMGFSNRGLTKEPEYGY